MINQTIKFKDRGGGCCCVYKFLVGSLLDYLTPTWSPHYVKNKILLKRAQHIYTRIICGMKKLDYGDEL